MENFRKRQRRPANKRIGDGEIDFCRHGFRAKKQDPHSKNWDTKFNYSFVFKKTSDGTQGD